MDFPLNLEKANWVTGLEEMEQELQVLFKNPRGFFAQSYSYGSFISLHATSELELENEVRETLKQMPILDVRDVVVEGNEVYVTVSYRGEEIKYKYVSEV